MNTEVKQVKVKDKTGCIHVFMVSVSLLEYFKQGMIELGLTIVF